MIYYSPYVSKSKSKSNASSTSSASSDDNAVRIATSLLASLSSSKSLNLRNKRLDCDLAALASMVRRCRLFSSCLTVLNVGYFSSFFCTQCVVPKAAYSALHFSKPSFLAMMEAIRSRSGAIVVFVKELLLNQGMVDDEDISGESSVRTLTVGLRALTSVLCTLEELKQLHRGTSLPLLKDDSSEGTDPTSSSSSSVEPRGASVDFKYLVELLFDCIRSRGAALSTFSTDEEEEKEFLFETAAACTFSLMKIKSFAADLTMEQWHTLGWTLIHPSAAVRQRLFSTLSLSIQMHPLHPKFLAYPCLFATDEALYPHAEQALGFAVQRLRRTHEELCSQAISQTGNIERLQRLADSLMPETVLPYLLHLLSYHPEFPSSIAVESEADKRRMKNLVRSVRMLLQVLQSSLINDSCNMSYLFKQLNTINQYYLDRHNASNCELHFVTRMTVKILSEQVKSSDNFQNHPGEIHLPAELFQRKSGAADGADSNSAAMVVLGAGTASGLEVAERAIDKVLQLAGKGNKSNKTAAGGRPAAATTATATARGINREDGDVAQIFKGRKRASESPAEDGHRKSTDRARSSLGSAEKALKPEKPSRLPEEAPTRAVPKRSAKEAVGSYREPVENDREMEKWEADAAQTKKPRRSSELSLPSATDLLRSSFSSATPRYSGGAVSFTSPVAAPTAAGRVSLSVSPRAFAASLAAPAVVVTAPPSSTRSASGKTTQDEEEEEEGEEDKTDSTPSTPAVVRDEEDAELAELFDEKPRGNKATTNSTFAAAAGKGNQGAVKARALKPKTNQADVEVEGKAAAEPSKLVKVASLFHAARKDAKADKSKDKKQEASVAASRPKRGAAVVEPAIEAGASRRSARPIRG